MQRLLANAGIVALGFSLSSLQMARADERFKGPDEDGTKPALTKIAGEGMMNSHAFQYLTELSDNVGARVPGTAEAQKAIAWGIAKMRAIGLENVHAEKWQLWRGWKRGSADAELLAPTRHKLHVDAMGWTGSTAASGVEGEIVPLNLFDLDQEMKEISRLKGKVVLVVAKGTPKKSGEMIFAQFGDVLRAAAKAGALVVVGGQGGSKASGLNLTHTGILGFDADFVIPVVSMTAEDQGLDGSFAYIKQHQSELANHLGDLVLDEGQGPVSEFQLGGRDDLVASFQPFSKSLANIREIKVDEKVESGTDTLPFSMAGLPGINMNQDSPDYKYTHHSAADALEAVKADVLTQNATLMALTA